MRRHRTGQEQDGSSGGRGGKRREGEGNGKEGGGERGRLTFMVGYVQEALSSYVNSLSPSSPSSVDLLLPARASEHVSGARDLHPPHQKISILVDLTYSSNSSSSRLLTQKLLR
eukprot:765196-Hanusia_phi.AAC.3